MSHIQFHHPTSRHRGSRLMYWQWLYLSANRHNLSKYLKKSEPYGQENQPRQNIFSFGVFGALDRFQSYEQKRFQNGCHHVENDVQFKGNVSEVQSQRTQLMNKDFIMAVRFILQHNDEKIDIDTSIFSVYILLHLLSFRLDKWMDESVSPFDVLEEVRKVMLLWDVTAKRKTTYTSLLPIITLLECQASPKEESQCVAAWILCNLTTVNARACGRSQVEIRMHAGIDDLTHLVGPLTENTLLNCLQANFFAGIYQTKIGTVLLCLNPNQQQVTPKALSDSLKSSLFLQSLVSEALASHFDTGHSQILIVSGESGSGKTHHARQLLGRLFDMAGGGPETDAFKHLSASLTVLQSLCSAATITNPDSSRVGYFIENYISDAAIYRTKIHCYILDKDRIVNIGKHEKNFHIFYQMLAGLTAEEKVKLHLSGYSTHNLCYLSPGVTQQNEAIDKKRFESWKNSLSLLGISFYDIMRILSAILLLGNVEFVEGPGLELDLVGNNEIKAVAALLGVSGVSLYRGFTTQTRNNRGQICRSIADVHAANHTKDALAKALYCRTMVSILRRANNMKCSNPTLSSESLDSSQDTSVPGGLSCQYSLTALTHSHQSSYMTRNKGVISILDMFGFEIAEVNGLEQLCINLCAETMQAFYNTHIFKSTQEALREDGIQLNADFFYFDNDPILELLSSRRDGILSLIDTECLVPKSTAVNLVLKIKSHHRMNNHFFEPLPKAESLFGIRHFAGKVVYDVTKFIPNNKDQISDDIVAIFSKQFCNFGFASYLFSHEIIQGNESGGRLQGMKHRILPYSFVDKSESSEYVGSLTQDSQKMLNNLLKILVHAKPHFVRCIKTNDQGESLVFDRETMIRQLKSLQVLETVHLMAGGLAHRMRYKAFKKRYSPFLKHRDSCKSESSVEECKAILDSFLKAMDSSQLPYVSTQWMLGKKYIFLSESTRQHLEALRWKQLHYYATLIKSQWKGYISRKTWPILKQQLHDQQLKWMTTVPSSGQNVRSTPKYEREKIENYHLLQMAAQLYKIDLGKPPRLPPSRSYTISDMMKLKYPQVRIMKKDYPANYVDGRKLSKGEQVNVIGPAPGRGFLVVQQRDTTLHIPHMLVELQSEPEAVGMDI